MLYHVNVDVHVATDVHVDVHVATDVHVDVYVATDVHVDIHVHADVHAGIHVHVDTDVKPHSYLRLWTEQPGCRCSLQTAGRKAGEANAATESTQTYLFFFVWLFTWPANLSLCWAI